MYYTLQVGMANGPGTCNAKIEYTYVKCWNFVTNKFLQHSMKTLNIT